MMSKRKEPSISPITYNYVEPKNVYKGEYDIPLAEKFAENRYKYNPLLGTYSTSNGDYEPNAGAVQLFDINTNNQRTKSYSNISRPYYINGQRTKLGHSERLGMRDLLNDFIPENTGEIEKPSSYKRSSNKEEQTNILLNLIQNASKYKDYLTNQNAIIKMWSERPPCSSSSASDPSCINFMNSISPDGSKYMHIVKNSYNNNDVKTASKALAGAYLEYKRNPLSYTGNVNEYKKQRTSSPTQESTPGNVSPTTQAFIDEVWGKQNRTPSPVKVEMQNRVEGNPISQQETLDGLTMEEWLTLLENQD